MLKKISLCLAMCTFLGLGASQLFAQFSYPELCSTQLCCDSTYNGVPFVASITWNPYEVECLYQAFPGPMTSYWTTCPNNGCND